ncbi:MAG TPA: N-acetyl-1-D-myo-inositol-2-amino-2-deoxy-alpha-D-glucopyranoside deacetylase [Mycobacterium sp.]|uniref:N-acetyl-1-D-myo-inositol-2-amino-2-deoxy-alpha- D-glucopyranoside deacetylase n=1 Tax=Mycolicibacterium sp. TaxID=2320850 RepID=UPI0025EF023F|nr:N-acetyl-1-D-myo-inositol-2-amino-2-deoxy-alpha-D-glucopyranoside deacetylase [Mycolicibacterium sp.]HPX35989.1 N-acetyl-1-D-myo-inositol-2-amino-2-deoxy-alpha-D-glucopyranoside deacetylase [Mycobacterium sp.]HQC77350.1 N-acetyl-1-D-myo-inositol-2-amino-2-deoxy-alpha-D-glucopyranoside deacetylase [Mycobacterium sp.]
MPAAPRVLFVHAHPDDETINNGVTIARCVADGAEVTVLTCTLGEEGEVIGDRWAGLAVDQADQLGGYRIGELTAALNALGVRSPRFLGGAGRWRDSGMPGTASRGRTTFTGADFDVLVAQLADEIADLRPHVVVTYDPNGGYGHPDHIQAHRVTTAAVVAAAGRWAVPKFYWTVTAATVFRAGLDALEAADVAPEWIAWPADATYGYPDDQITAVVEAPEHLPAKISAMLAHATQMTVGPTGRAFTLSNNVILPVVAAEHYVLVSGLPGEVDEKGWEQDLFAGLDLE